MMRFINQINLSDTIEKLKSGELKLTDHINFICDRIDALDKEIMAFLPEPGRRERLLKEASELEKYFENKQKPALYGLLIGVKDIFRVDGFETRCGSNLPSKLFEGEEAETVSKMKKAGALVLGKTVTTEFAYFEPGVTHNPHYLNHTPGGSSSGSAAAVAAGLCAFAFGTQTIGSIMRPASYCGVIGYKPGFGRISTAGVIPFSPTVDHVGFFTQDIEGAEIAASVLCENWKQKEISESLPALGIPDGRYLEQADKDTIMIFENLVKKLSLAGFVIKRINCFEDIENINKMHRQICAYDMWKVHENWYVEYLNLYRHHTEKMILDGQAVSQEELKTAISQQRIVTNKFETLMAEQGIDAWICPSSLSDAPEGLASTGSPIMNLPWTYMGFPVISLPVMKTERNLPIGVQVIAGKNMDEFLFESAKKICLALVKN